MGGGLIGLSSAYYLARRDWRVTVLERGHIGSGASHGNCGYVCPSHAMPMAAPGAVGRTLRMMLKRDSALSIPLRWNPSLWKWLFHFSRECRVDRMLTAASGRNALLASSMKLYRELQQQKDFECEWQDRGLLLVYKSKHEFDEFRQTADLLKREFSIEAVPHAGEEVRELEPALREGMAGGWHFTSDAHVRPDKLLAAFRKACEQQGVTIREGVEVKSIQISTGKVTSIETTAGAMTADLFVLATGAEAPKFAKPLRCRIPIQPGKGYSITMAAPSNIPKIPMIFEEHHVAVTPMDGAFRVGSTMEFTGYDSSLNSKRLALLRKSAMEHLVEPLPETVTEEWCGWRPMVYDGLPCIDKTPGASNVIVAAGNGMIGLATAPATGRLVSEIATDAEPHIPAEPYSVKRFS